MAVSGEDWGPRTIIEVYTTLIDAMNQARAIAGPLSAELEELPHRLDSAATDPVRYSPCT